MQSRQFPKPEVQTSTRRGFEDYFKDYEVFCISKSIYIFWNFFPTSVCALCAVKNVFTSIYLDFALLLPGNLKNRLGLTLREENILECFLCFLFFFINAKVHMIVIKAV